MGTFTSHFFSPRSRILPALFFCVLLAAFSSGCSGRVGTEAIRSDLSVGSVDSLEEKLKETHESYGEFVTACNLARVYQIAGRWRESISAYNDALVILEDYENRAVVNIRSMASNLGTMFFSRGAGEYYGTGYERSLLHTFNALNYLMLEDFSGAAVEMRRMDKRQEIWLEESQARIDKYLESEKRLESPDDLPAGYTMRDILRNAEVRDMVNNYQDAFSYALAALVYRLAGDMQSAGVSLGRAAALDESIGTLAESVWPGKCFTPNSGRTSRPGMPQLPQAHITTVPANGENTAPQTQEAVVIAFSGLAPALNVENVRIWFPPVGYLLIDLPAYKRPVFGSSPRVFASFGEREQTIPLHPLLHTDRLAYRTLWDEVRMEATFAVTRALTRAGISATTYAVARSNEDTRAYAPLLAMLATAIMDVFSTSASGSIRNWETLPNTGYLAMDNVPRGSVVTVSVGGDKASVRLPLDARGVIIVVTELSNSNVKVHHVTY